MTIAMPYLSEDEILDRAINAEARHCERNGYIFQQSAAALSYVDGDRIVLVNVNGPLAEYRWTGKQAVRQ